MSLIANKCMFTTGIKLLKEKTFKESNKKIIVIIQIHVAVLNQRIKIK
jgi:hypothetical protein